MQHSDVDQTPPTNAGAIFQLRRWSAENATSRKRQQVQGVAAPVLRRHVALYVSLVVVQMRWLSALNTIELALLILSAGMMTAGVLLLLEIVLVHAHVSWQ